MVEKLTDEQQKQKTEALDALYSHIFTNLRNLGISISLMMAGGAIFKYREELQFGSTINAIISLVVCLAAAGLLLWTIWHGIEKFARPVKGQWAAWRIIPFAILYSISVIVVFQAMLLLNAENQLRPHATVNAISPSSPTQTAAPPDQKQISSRKNH